MKSAGVAVLSLLTAFFLVLPVFGQDAVLNVEDASVISNIQLSVQVGQWLCYVADASKVKKGDFYAIIEPTNNDGTLWNTLKIVDPAWAVWALEDGQDIRLCLLVSEANNFNLTTVVYRDGLLIYTPTDPVYPVPLGSIESTITPLNSDGSLEVNQPFSVQVDGFLNPDIGPEEGERLYFILYPLFQEDCSPLRSELESEFDGRQVHITYSFQGQRVACTGSVMFSFSLLVPDTMITSLKP